VYYVIINGPIPDNYPSLKVNILLSNMNDDTSLITFKVICNFVNDLNSVYGLKHKPLKLYRRLVNKTQISHDRAIKRHVDGAREFCMSNREAIISSDHTKFKQKKIIYSDRVYIDMALIFRVAEKDTIPIIWKHLLTLSACVDPSSKAKELLRKNAEDGKSGMNEANFLTDIISKVENNIEPNANPMDAVSSIMQSGVFTELLNGMQGGLSSGELDISKLLGAVQGMVTSLGKQIGNDPEAAQAMGMLNKMSAQIEDISENEKKSINK
jgi:hypothetical protein